MGRSRQNAETTPDPLKKTIVDIKNNYKLNGASPIGKMSSASSFFYYSSKSSQNESVPYWDLLSLDDVREYEKQKARERDVKMRAQRQLRSCLEGQMRENNFKKNINHMENFTNNGLLLDSMNHLEQDHQFKV